MTALPDPRRSEPASAYDVVPYPGHPFAQTHPDRLAALGTLFRIDPPPVDGCRVLELGCGDGGNLVPMAVALPGARFLGIDASERAIGRGRQLVEALGLTNATLEVAAIEELEPPHRRANRGRPRQAAGHPARRDARPRAATG